MTDVLKIKTRYDLPVGTLFTVNDDETVLKVVKSDDETAWRCVNCYYNDKCSGSYNLLWAFNYTPCEARKRQDGQAVIFKEGEV